MKKIAVLLLALCLALTPFASLAEEAVAITWDEVGAPLVETLGMEGDFVALSEMGLALWVPSDLLYVEPSADEAAAGLYASFIDQDQECMLTVTVTNVEGMTLDLYLQSAIEAGMNEPVIVNVNGLDCVSYDDLTNNYSTLALVDTNCNIILFSFAPIDNDVARLGSTVIFASLMPLE